MKIMATFDGSEFAESTLPLLCRLAALPGAEFILFCASDDAHEVRAGNMKPIDQAYGLSGQGSQPRAFEQKEPSLLANKSQAIDARLDQIETYLRGIGGQLPAGSSFTTNPEVDKDGAAAIMRAAERLAPDVIVMSTHGRTGLAKRFVGSVTEKVIQSGVAPVLVIHPQDVKDARK